MREFEERLYDSIVEYGIATEDEINLVRCVKSGTWEEILNAIVYARTGYLDFEQFYLSEIEEED